MRQPVLKKDWECEVCGKCVISCPVNAITFELKTVNYEPTINRNKCIGCLQCEKACEKCILRKDSMDDTKSFICQSINANTISASSSGGVFTELARFVFKNDGVVLGAAFNKENHLVEHILATNEFELQRLRKSKYVQSNPVQIYEYIKKCIEQKKLVLVTGTPCQIAPLQEKYGNNENLILADLYCHGVANSGVYRDYIERMPNLEKIDFRFPGNRGNYYFDFVFKDGREIKKWCDEDVFYRSFINGYNLKRSCYDCKYATNKHPSDFTLGDWVRKPDGFCSHPSILTINTLKGKSIFEQIKDELKYEKVHDNSFVKRNYYVERKAGEEPWGYNAKLSKEFVELCLKSSAENTYKVVLEIDKRWEGDNYE